MVAFVFAAAIAIISFCYIRSMHYYKMSEDLSLPYWARKEYKETSDAYANVSAVLAVFAAIFMFTAAGSGVF